MYSNERKYDILCIEQVPNKSVETCDCFLQKTSQCMFRNQKLLLYMSCGKNKKRDHKLLNQCKGKREIGVGKTLAIQIG